jgi:hypothetical protein
MQLIIYNVKKEKNSMKHILIASILSLLIPFSVNVLADNPDTTEKDKSGFVAVDLMDTYQLNLTPNVESDKSFTGDDKKVLFFDVNIMKLKLNYDFQNTETAIKQFIP